MTDGPLEAQVIRDLIEAHRSRMHYGAFIEGCSYCAAGPALDGLLSTLARAEQRKCEHGCGQSKDGWHVVPDCPMHGWLGALIQERLPKEVSDTALALLQERADKAEAELAQARARIAEYASLAENLALWEPHTDEHRAAVVQLGALALLEAPEEVSEPEAAENRGTVEPRVATCSEGDSRASGSLTSPELERNVQTLRECVIHIARGCRSSGPHDSVGYESTIDNRLTAILAEIQAGLDREDELRQVVHRLEEESFDLAAVVAERDVLREALRFYAEPENYRPRHHTDGWGEPSSDAEADGGMRARAALAGVAAPKPDGTDLGASTARRSGGGTE